MPTGGGLICKCTESSSENAGRKLMSNGNHCVHEACSENTGMSAGSHKHHGERCLSMQNWLLSV